MAPSTAVAHHTSSMLLRLGVYSALSSSFVHFHFPCSPPASVKASPSPPRVWTRGRKRGAEDLPLLVCAVAIVSSFSLVVHPTHPSYRHRGIVLSTFLLTACLLLGPVCFPRSLLRRATGAWEARLAEQQQISRGHHHRTWTRSRKPPPWPEELFRALFLLVVSLPE